MKISYDTYNVFYYVAKFKSITLASHFLHISQPAVTRHIKNLELYLGVTLFLRNKNGLHLTKDGKNLFDNVKEGIYNVFIMDETHSILATGAGGVTKMKDPHGPKIERIFNFKFPYEYIDRFDLMNERKEQVKDFYERYPL
jgi:hypothetical protein